MSSHTRNSGMQTTGDGGQAKFHTALRIATVIVEANQRLFKLQSEAANAAFAENSKHLMNSLSAKDSGALLGEWASLYEANTRRVLDVTRSYFEIVPQTQAEIANLMGGPFASANNETQQYLDQFTKAISDGRDAAAASVKEFLAKAVANSASVTRAMKKEKVA
jgi:phasin family protein